MLLNLMFNLTGSKDTEPVCYHMISGSGYDWFYDPVNRYMVEIPRGTEIVKISDNTDSKGRVLVRAPFQFLMIPAEEVIDLGFN